MSPMEVWCCEAQERYVLAVLPEDLDRFLALCERERCPAAHIGDATGDGHLTLVDDHFSNTPIDIDLQVILGKPPRMLRDVTHIDILGTRNHERNERLQIRLHTRMGLGHLRRIRAEDGRGIGNRDLLVLIL